MFEWLFSVDAWLTLATLTALEIVLGVDNVIMLAVLVAKLPAHQRDKARYLGLGLAMFARIALLFSLFLIMKLTASLFTLPLPEFLPKNSGEISGRDLVLFFGGLFLVVKPIFEIKEQICGVQDDEKSGFTSNVFWLIIAQIIFLDIVFSLDSVITAVGIAQNLPIMVLAIVIAVLVMLFASKPIADFVEKYPSIKLLALAFLVLVGLVLMAESIDLHISKAYIYVAMAFSLIVECLNIIASKNVAK
mgnify:FL=1